MGRTVSIGAQEFDEIRDENLFYIDKTNFIKEWWESKDKVTLITRPRRFGKTLNMSMLECFFSTRYEGRADLFEGLKIWEDEKYHEIQGTLPVIFLSFAAVKTDNLEGSKQQIKNRIVDIYESCRFILKDDKFSANEKNDFDNINSGMSDVQAADSINKLSRYLSKYYGKKVIILLDEYDTPMQEAWLGGYWDELTGFIRSLFNSTFKTNPYLERALMTGITRVSKESIFSDLNNLEVITTTSNKYETAFGFTEKEVFEALDEMDLSDEKADVKMWYDGFTFGRHRDIYNPWSISNFLDKREYKEYWANTSGNGLISNLLQKSGKDVKQEFESLMQENAIDKTIDEQIIFNQLDDDENAIWSLMVASGYLRIDEYYMDVKKRRANYKLKITNWETLLMFESMTLRWFGSVRSNYNDFIKAMLKNNVELMNIYMNEVALSTFSNFDSGNNPSGRTEPERFYHGFVLGLLVDLRDRYEIKSNRESGYGRYDICLIPLNETDPGIVIEFKVIDKKRENSLEDTVATALKQINDKKYDTVLFERGVSEDRIHRYGFAFEGKTVLIGE